MKNMHSYTPTRFSWLLHMLLGVALCCVPTIAAAQTGAAQNDQQFMKTSIKVSIAQEGASPANIPVFLRAARVKGPFEPTDPEPEHEWKALTNAQGEATFDKVPQSVIDRGLRLQAVANFDDSLYKSPQVTPTPNLKITLPIYEKGFDLSTLQVDSVRMIVEPWEDYLVYTQMWSISVTGQQALDVSLIPDPDFEKGIPFELPLKARGINFNGTDGESKVINSIVYWKGVIKPGQPVSFQLRYSIPVKDSAVVYEQRLDYPTKKLEIIVPLETPYKNKLPRLNGLGIKAPGFNQDDIRSGFNIPGLRPDREFLYAVRNDLPKDAGIKFQLYNLPYAPSKAPWIALLIGAFGILVVIAFAYKEKKSIDDASYQRDIITVLEEEKLALFEELDALKQELQSNHISERDYEIETAQIMTRLGLIIKKLDERRPEQAASKPTAS